MTAYSPTAWVNGGVPAINATNLNHLKNELALQASDKSISHTLPTWANGVAPAVSDAAPLNEMERVAQAVATSVGLSYTPTGWGSGWTPARNATNLNKLEAQAQANRTAIDASFPPPTATVFVATTGNDTTGNGTQGNPYATLAKAMAVSSSGAVIGMAAGTYTINSTVTVKNGVGIVGAGGRNSATVLRGSAQPLISLSGNTTAATIQAIKLDGQNKSAGNQGGSITNCQNITVHDMFATSFTGVGVIGGALAMHGCTNCTVRYSEFRDSGEVVVGDHGFGSLSVADMTGCVFHDIVLHDIDCPGLKGDGVNYFMTNCEFYNLTCTQLWTGVFPDFEIVFELFECDATNVRVHHSYFKGSISLTDPGSGSALPAGQYRIEIDHNYFEIPDATGVMSGGHPVGVSIEDDFYSISVHHNYIKGGAQVLTANQPPPAKTGSVFHHNVIDQQEAPYYQVANITAGLAGYEFYENTYLASRGGLASGLFNTNTGDSPNVHDNIFSSTTAQGDKWGTAGTAVTSHNYFYNITAKGATATQAGSQPLPLSGGFPAAFTPAGAPANAYGAFADGAWSDIGPQ